MSKLPQISELYSCPYCGEIEYYTRDKAFGYIITRKALDGGEVTNEDMYDGLSITTGIYVFCANCHKKIARSRE